MDFLETTVADLAAAVRNGDTTARSLTEHALAKVEELNPTLNAFVAVDGDAALAAADGVDEVVASGGDPGPLAGIPIGVKDLEDAAGFVTTYGSALHANALSAENDSVLVARMRAAGCVVIGKTNTPEFGHKATSDNEVFPTTANPWDPTQTPGGSSGGTGAALAAGMVPLATGSDGGGSIRIPAALCGLSAIKCQQGRIGTERTGQRPSMLLSIAGPMARTAADTALALDATKGPHWADIFSLPPDPTSWHDVVGRAEPPKRVVWSPTMGFSDVSPDVAGPCAAAVEKLEAAGTEVIVDDTVFDLEPLRGWATNWFVYFHNLLGHHKGTPEWDKISDSLKPMIEMGADVTGGQAADAIDRMSARNYEVSGLMERHNADAILTPTTARTPPTLAQIAGDNADLGWVQFTFGLNMTRHPAGTVCVGRANGTAGNGGGLPVGLQIIGRHFDEPGVLATMAVMEKLVGPIGRPALAGPIGRPESS